MLTKNLLFRKAINKREPKSVLSHVKNEIKKVELSQRLSDFKLSFEGCIRIRVG